MRLFSLDALARWSLILLYAATPFFFLPLAWATVSESKVLLAAALLLVAGIAWFSGSVRRGGMRAPKSAVFFLAFLLPVVYACSWALSGFSTLSLVGTGVEQDTLVAAVVASAALLLTVLVFIGKPADILSPVRALFAGVLVLVCIAILHLVAPGFPLSAALAGQTANAFGSWHELGIVLGLSFFAGLALFDTPFGEGVWRYVFLILAFLSGLFLIVVNLPDIWGALAAAAFLSCAYQLYRHQGYDRRAFKKVILWGIIGLVSLVFVFFGSAVWRSLPQSFQVANLEINPSWQGTLAVERQLITKPAALFFGAGPNTFVRQWSLYKPAVVNQTQYWNADFNSGVGSVPTALITVGVIGFLAWVLFIAALLWSLMRGALQNRRDPFGGTLFSLGLAGLYLMLFHVLYTPGPALNIITFLLVGVFVAFAAASGRMRLVTAVLSFDSWQGYLRSFLVGAGALALLLSGVSALRVNVAELFVNRSILVYSSTQDITKATMYIQRALAVYPGDGRAHRAGIELGAIELQKLAAQPDADSALMRAQLQATLQQAIQHGLAAVSIDSGDYQNWLELAGLYQDLAGAKVEGAYDNATLAYQNALTVSPSNPLLYLRLAQLEILEQKPDAALKDIASALALKPDFAAPHYLASQVYASQQNLKQASDEAALAVRYAPDDPLTWYNAGIIAYARGDWQGAVANQEQALVRNPQYGNALYVLGLSYYKLGRTAEALSTFKTLKQVDPGQQGTDQILKNLEEGKGPLAATSTPPGI